MPPSCSDSNNDHVCEICGKVSACGDENNDHLCDLCGKVLTDCVDENNDQACDICGKTSGGAGYVEYSWDGTKLVSQNKNTETVTAILASSQSLSEGWYVVRGDVSVAQRLKVSGTVNLILADGATLTAQQGIEVPGGTTLNIYAQTGGTGKLIAQNGGVMACAIGSANLGTAGAINIHGGNITATIDNGRYASAIGNANRSTGGVITIYHGDITAVGGEHCAGIGSGTDAEGVDITIYGGTIRATGGKNGTGIGGGYCAEAGNVTIYGGSITATGGAYGAGIGSGYCYSHAFTDTGAVTIHGGTITATGGGQEAAGATVVITGGNVKAVAGRSAEAIGKGYEGTDSGTLKDASGNDLRLVTITLDGVTQQVAVTKVDGIGSYGLKDVKTLDTNKLYFYLPSTGNPTGLTAGGKPFEGTVENGAGTFYSHIHSWTYAASGDTITATCEGELGACPNKTVTIKLNALENLTYDGTTKTVTVTQTPAGVFTDIPAVTYEGDCMNVGSYYANLTYGGVTARLGFTINPATPVLTWENQTVTYTGKAARITAPTVKLIGDEPFTGSVDYTYQHGSGTTPPMPGLPTDAGTYTITATIEAEGNYGEVTDTMTLTITKAAASEIQWPTASGLTYGQTLSDSNLTSTDPNGTFAWQGGSIVPTVTNNGYVVVYTPNDTNNYDYTNVALTNTIPITVSKAALTVTAKDNTITYGDAPYANGITCSGFVNGETEAVLNGTVLYSYSYEQFGNVGIYQITPAGLTAYYIIKGDGSSWTQDSSSTISLTANGAYNKFVGIKVDGVEASKANYEAKSGSTIITLKASYLDTLAVGEHTITVVYTDGSADGTFKIVAKPATPATGDDFNIALYGSLMVVSVIALVVLLLASKKRKQAK